MAFDTSGITAYTEENATQFFSRSVLGAKIAARMNRITGIKSSRKLPTLNMEGDMFQANAACGFNDGNHDLVIEQRELAVEPMKINEKLCIQDLEEFFTQKILPSGSEYTNVPPELQFMDLVVEQITKTVELAIVGGEKGGANALLSLRLFDGMNHIIDNEIVATTIPGAQQHALSTASGAMIATLDTMFDSLPDDQADNVEQDGDWVFYMSPKAKRTYERDFRTAHGALPYNSGFNKDEYDTTGIKIVSLVGLTDTPDRIILTRESNWWLGADIDGEETSLTLKPGAGSEADFLFLVGKFKLGVQVKFPDELVVNI